MSSGRPGGRAHGATSESVHHASQALFWVATVFSLPRFLVVWVIYILIFLLTPRPSQQRLELTRLRVLPRDEPRSFNS